MYHDKVIYIATKHEKEKVIKPIFENLIGCKIKATENFDTDFFGTFSGEVKRKLSAHETCIAKAKTAAKQFNLDYVIASEGSFLPHPNLFFIPADIEMLVFFDATKNIIIDESLISTETNYAYIDVSKNDNYEDFLEKINFPSHKLILKNLDNQTIIEKGIDDLQNLYRLIKKTQNDHINIRIETDMRAMCNPTRMLTIGKLAEQLAKRIIQYCPSCAYPGFGKAELSGQLPCEECGFDSTLYKDKVLSCVHCDFKIYKGRDDGMQYSSSQYCKLCNP